MAFVPPKDRVLEHSTSNSQTVFTVTGALDTSYNAFSTSMSVGDTTIGAVVEAGVAFKSGILSYSATNQVTVSTAFESKGTFSAGGVKEVFMGLPAASALMVDGGQALSEAQKVQARSNLSAAQLAAMAMHNVAVNPAVDVSQELGGAASTLANNTAKYTADCWEGMYNHGAATAVVTSQQHTFSGEPGFTFGHRITATTAISSPASGDFAKHRQKIEGYRISHWGWGAAGAASIVVAFKLFSTVSGVAFVKISNSDQSRCYYHEITVASGWNFYAFAVPGDTSGTWQASTSTGLTFEVFVSGKETTPASSLDAWGSTNKVQTTNSTNLLGTNANLTVVSGLYIDVGTQIPTAADLPGLMRSFDREIQLCKRYWRMSYDYGTLPGAATTTGMIDMVIGAATTGSLLMTATFEVEMRATPVGKLYDLAGAADKVLKSANGKTGIINVISTKMINAGTSDATSAAELAFHYTANARL